MKLNLNYIGALATAGIFAISGCSIKNNMGKNKYQVEPEVLEAHGDSVTFTVTAVVPEKSINPKANIRFEPVLKTQNGGEIALRTMTVGGEKNTDPVDVKINSKTGGKVSYSAKFPYKDEMKKSQLMSGFSIKSGADYQSVNNVAGVQRELAKGTITTSTLYKREATPIPSPDSYLPEIMGQSVDIYFKIDNAKFDPAFTVKPLKLSNKAQIIRLQQLLKKDPSFVVQRIVINSYASPDGELQRNNGLSQSRSQSSFAYFKKEIKKLGFSEANDSNFTLTYDVSEDWNGVRMLVEASNLADKNEMLVIINNKSINDDQREEMLRNNHRKSYDYLISDVFPKLRRSTLTVQGIKPLKTDEQLKSYINNLDSLNATELIHLGYIIPGVEEKLRVMQNFQARYPNDWRAHNNVAVMLIYQKKYNEALAELKKAEGLENVDRKIMLSNAGICFAYLGNRDKAFEYFKKAENNYYCGVISIAYGRYGDAISYLQKSGKNDYNTGLAYLLNKDYEMAKKIFDYLKPEEMDVWTYYMKAILGARMNNAEYMSSNLTRAVQMDGNIRFTAKDDLEFRNFYSNPLFQAAVK